MSQTGVRLSLLLSLLTITISSGCTDYICRHEYPDGKSVTKIPVNKGDKMIIYEHFFYDEFVPTKKFCRNKTPRNIRSTNGLKINLKIERWTKGGRGGRDCRIKCLE